MNALMKLLAKAGVAGKGLAGQIGNIGKGGAEIIGGGSGALVGAGGKSEALKKLLMANKPGVLGAAGVGLTGGSAAYGAHEMMEDDESESIDELMEYMKKKGQKVKGYMP
jgi:hypothetical protein